MKRTKATRRADAEHHADGSQKIPARRPLAGSIVLAPDVQAYFPDADAVNTALRGLMALRPRRQATLAETQNETAMTETRNEQPMLLLPTELETRLRAVETALHDIQCQLATLTPTSHWLEQIIGSCKNNPAFEEMIALGRAFRESQPYPEELEDAV